jgi:hypothetical protein
MAEHAACSSGRQRARWGRQRSPPVPRGAPSRASGTFPKIRSPAPACAVRSVPPPPTTWRRSGSNRTCFSESPRPTPVSPNPGDRPARGLVVSAFIVGTADHVHAAVSPQQIAVPSYIHPGADPGAWNRLIGAPSEKAGITVANVLNGPDFRRKPIWTDVMARAHGSGKRVLGYVDTGYLGLTGQKTRLGSSDPADWIAQAEQDINVWYALYGESLDGIFFDQGYNTCGPNNDFASWYDHLNQFEKRHHPGALTVLNPGAVVPQCYEDTADILLMYESDYAGYRGQNPIGDLNFHAPDWTPRDPHKIWHIIYDARPNTSARCSTSAASGTPATCTSPMTSCSTRMTRCPATTTGAPSRPVSPEASVPWPGRRRSGPGPCRRRPAVSRSRACSTPVPGWPGRRCPGRRRITSI